MWCCNFSPAPEAFTPHVESQAQLDCGASQVLCVAYSVCIQNCMLKQGVIPVACLFHPDRFSLSASSCLFPFVHQGQVYWDCINSTATGSSRQQPTAGNPRSSSSQPNSTAGASATAATAGQVISGVLTGMLGVCPVPTGGWEMCAPRRTNTR